MPEQAEIVKEKNSLETLKPQKLKISDGSQKSEISDRASEKTNEEKKIEKVKKEKSEKEDINEKVKKEKSEKEDIKEKVKKESKERIGIVYIYTSFNNTILHITDMAGNTIARVSGGMVTKHDRLKANPTIAMFVAKQAAEKAREAGINSLYVRIKAKTGSPAPGPGAHAAVKSLSREGMKIISIIDTTKVARGGPKVKGGRRGRRV